jgi:hypothetical protein
MRDSQSAPVELAPHFLERRGHAQEQSVWATGANVFNDCLVTRAAGIAVAESGNLEVCIAGAATPHESLDYLAPPAQKEMLRSFVYPRFPDWGAGAAADA